MATLEDARRDRGDPRRRGSRIGACSLSEYAIDEPLLEKLLKDAWIRRAPGRMLGEARSRTG